MDWNGKVGKDQGWIRERTRSTAKSTPRDPFQPSLTAGHIAPEIESRKCEAEFEYYATSSPPTGRGFYLPTVIVLDPLFQYLKVSWITYLIDGPMNCFVLCECSDHYMRSSGLTSDSDATILCEFEYDAAWMIGVDQPQSRCSISQPMWPFVLPPVYPGLSNTRRGAVNTCFLFCPQISRSLQNDRCPTCWADLAPNGPFLHNINLSDVINLHIKMLIASGRNEWQPGGQYFERWYKRSRQVLHCITRSWRASSLVFAEGGTTSRSHSRWCESVATCLVAGFQNSRVSAKNICAHLI